jgi:hypothetical protein
MTLRDKPFRRCAPRSRRSHSDFRGRARGFRQSLLLAAAFAALVCLLAAGGLWHHDDPNTAAACPICQIANMPATGPAVQPVLVVVQIVVAIVPQAGAILYAAPGLFPNSSRAPPIA